MATIINNLNNLTSRLEEFNNAKIELNNQAKTYLGSLNYYQTQKSKVEANLQSLSYKLQQQASEINFKFNCSAINNYGQQLENTARKIETKEGNLENCKTKNQKLSKKLTIISRCWEEINKKYEECEAHKSESEAKLNELLETTGNLSSKIEENKEKKQHKQQKIREFYNSARDTEEQITRKSSELEEARNTLKTLRSEHQQADQAKQNSEIKKQNINPENFYVEVEVPYNYVNCYWESYGSFVRDSKGLGVVCIGHSLIATVGAAIGDAFSPGKTYPEKRFRDKSYQDCVKAANKEIESNKAKLEEKHSQITSKTNEIKELEKSLENLKHNKQQFEAESDKFREEQSELDEEIQDLETRYDNELLELKKARENKESIDKIINNLDKNKQKFEEKYSKYNREKTSQLESIKLIRGELSELNKQKEMLENYSDLVEQESRERQELAAYEDSYNKALNEYRQLTKKHSETQQEIEGLISRLNEAISEAEEKLSEIGAKLEDKDSNLAGSQQEEFQELEKAIKHAKNYLSNNQLMGNNDSAEFTQHNASSLAANVMSINSQESDNNETQLSQEHYIYHYNVHRFSYDQPELVEQLITTGAGNSWGVADFWLENNSAQMPPNEESLNSLGELWEALQTIELEH